MNWQLVEQAENINLSAPWIPGNQETPGIRTWLINTIGSDVLYVLLHIKGILWEIGDDGLKSFVS